MKDAGTECHDDNIILKNVKKFYVDLYSVKGVDLNSPIANTFLNRRREGKGRRKGEKMGK